MYIQKRQNILDNVRKLLKMFGPILISQISITLMVATTIVFAGHVSVADFAAVSLGVAIWVPTSLFGLGLLLAITPITAYYYGANEYPKIEEQITQGVWITIFISLILGLLVWHSDILLQYMQLDPILFGKTTNFLKIMAIGFPVYFLLILIRSINDGLGRTKPIMQIVFLGLILSLFYNYLFIYGKLNPTINGAIGAAVAVNLSYLSMLIMAFIYIKYSSIHQRLQTLQHFFGKPNYQVLKKIVYLGIPLALALCSESCMFDIIAILIAHLGENIVASNQIVITTLTVFFTIPLSLGMATTIIVGQCLGAQDYQQAKKIYKITLCIGISVTIGLISIIITNRYQLIDLFIQTDDLMQKQEITITASAILMIAMMFNISDTIQVITSCTLRAYKDTTFIFIVTFICYWIIGLGCGYILALTDIIVPKMGVYGFWYGILFGLTTAAISLVIRIIKIQKMPTDKLYMLLTK